MIELFDPARLVPRRDRSAQAAVALSLLGAAGVLTHGLHVQGQLDEIAVQHRALQADVGRRPVEVGPTPALLAELQRQVDDLEAEAAGGLGSAPGLPLTAVQWMDRLETLGKPDVVLVHVDIDRAGGVRVEGQARNPQALSGYVEGWERQEGLLPVRARDIEVKQDPAAPPMLRFALRAQASPARDLPERAP